MNVSQSIDPRAVLGVPPDATLAEINKAYRRLARLHADGQRGLGDEAELRLKEINTARALLVKTAKRRPEPPVAARRPATRARAMRRVPRRAAVRFFDGMGVAGLHRANQISRSETAAASDRRGRVNSAFRGAPHPKPVFGL
jgi:curved DNA-binding protein CbpA